MKTFLVFLLLCGILIACSSAPASITPLESDLGSKLEIPILTLEPTQSPVLPSPTMTVKPPTVTATSFPSTKTPLPACVTLIYAEYAQFEIISPSGLRILVDIYDPENLSSPVSVNDILLTTHTHWDHMNENFQTTFPGKQLFVQTGVLEAPGVIIHGIASAHNAGDRLMSEGGTNYIYLIEIDGLRIAHFGDIGQNALTEEQLPILGTIDIAITQINNSYSDMSAENRKGINLMSQLQPRLVIPTHYNLDTVKLAVALWDGYYAESSNVEICKTDLNRKGTSILLIGESVETMKKYINLVSWGEQ